MAGQEHILNAQKRTVTGRKVKKLRRDGMLPANIYGKKVESVSVQVSLQDFNEVYSEVGETGLVNLKLNGETRPTLIHHVQLDPVTDLPLHTDFLQVDLHEKVRATVPIEFTGESPLEKSGEGIVVPQMREIEVEALPMDLPEKIVVDISGLGAVGDGVKVADLNVDRSKVTLKEEDPERIVVNVEEPAKEEVVEAPPAPEGEVPAEGEAPAEGVEGEAPAEGEKPEEGGSASPAERGKGKPTEGGEEGKEKKKEG